MVHGGIHNSPVSKEHDAADFEATTRSPMIGFIPCSWKFNQNKTSNRVYM